jgi:acyl carrier protein
MMEERVTPHPGTDQLLDLVRTLSRELRPGANGIDRLGLDHELERDFGLDSLARVELLARIERELGVRLDEAALAEAETPRDLLQQMAEAGPGARTAPAPAVTTAETTLEPPPETLATLVELLDWHVAQHGDRVHITLYGDAEHSEDISYRVLQAEAQALAAGLLAQGLGSGDRTASEFIETSDNRDRPQPPFALSLSKPVLSLAKGACPSGHRASTGSARTGAGFDRSTSSRSARTGSVDLQEGEGVVRERHRHHVAEYQQGGEPGGDALAPGFAALEGDGAKHDVEDQREELGGEPAVRQRELLQQYGEADAAGEQEGVVDVRDDAHPARLQAGGARHHPDAAQNEQREGEGDGGEVQGFECGVVHGLVGVCVGQPFDRLRVNGG